MTPGSVFFLFAGLALVISGIKNRGMLDTILGNDTEQESGKQTVPASLTSLLDDTVNNWQDHVVTPSDRRGHVPSGVSVFDGHPVARWIVPVLKWARANGWKGHVISGYRTIAQQREACAHTTGPCAEPGKSEHQSTTFPGGAVDVTDYQTLASLVSRYPGPGPTLTQATFANDPGHFSGNGH